MMMLWAWAGVPLGVYNIVSGFSVALQVQPQILTALSLVTWAQCFYYQRKWSPLRALSAVVPVTAVMAGCQTALILGLQKLKRDQPDVKWPMILMAVLSAALLAAGVLRHYWDIWIHRTVRGVSFLFCGIDAAGDVFSLLSILFTAGGGHELDVLGIVIYATEFVLWCGIFAAGGWYNLVPWMRRRGWLRRLGAGGNGVNGGEDGSRDLEAETDGMAGGGAGAGSSGNDAVMLHDTPSSTSVFRTASRSTVVNEPVCLRSRSGVSVTTRS